MLGSGAILMARCDQTTARWYLGNEESMKAWFRKLALIYTSVQVLLCLDWVFGWSIEVIQFVNASTFACTANFSYRYLHLRLRKWKLITCSDLVVLHYIVISSYLVYDLPRDNWSQVMNGWFITGHRPAAVQGTTWELPMLYDGMFQCH